MTAFLLTAAALVTILGTLLVLEVGPFFSLLWDESAARTAPFRERLARAWADLKSSVAQKARAGARLVKLLGQILVGGVVLIPTAILVFLGYAIGTLLAPLGFLKAAFLEPLQESYEDSTRRLTATLDGAYWDGRDAFRLLRAGE